MSVKIYHEVEGLEGKFFSTEFRIYREKNALNDDVTFVLGIAGYKNYAVPLGDLKLMINKIKSFLDSYETEAPE